jgi:hypothetical protein
VSGQSQGDSDRVNLQGRRDDVVEFTRAVGDYSSNAGATRCYERWFQRWTEHLRQIRSTVGATNVPATRCSECLIQKVWYKRLSGLSRVQP